MREAATVGKISDYQPGGPGLNFGRPSFATPFVDRDVKPFVGLVSRDSFIFTQRGPVQQSWFELALFKGLSKRTQDVGTTSPNIVGIVLANVGF